VTLTIRRSDEQPVQYGGSKNLKTIIYVTVVSNIIINNESEKKIPKPHRLGFPLSSLCIVDASCAAVVVVIT
jgi:hypothetical protein